MKIRTKTLTENDLKTIAADLGLVSGLEEKTQTRNGTTFSGRILLDGPNNKKNPHRYGRVSASYHGKGRHIAATCWHGHRDFMRAVYEKDPGAVIITHAAKYTGSEHFEQTHQSTYYMNVGAPIAPCYMGDACNC